MKENGIPTNKGVNIDAIAVVPYARPILSSENCKVTLKYVPKVTYHAPQMKYWRNIIAASLI